MIEYHCRQYPDSQGRLAARQGRGLAARQVPRHTVWPLHRQVCVDTQIVAKYHEIIGCWKLNQFFYSSRADRLTDKELGDLLASTYMTMTK